MIKARRSNDKLIPELIQKEDDIRAFFSGHVLPNASTWCGFDGPDIVAVMVLVSTWIEQLYIAPEHSGTGIGERLIAIAKARTASLDVWVSPDSERTQAFYERLDFATIATTDRDNVDSDAPDVHRRWIAPDVRFVPPDFQPPATLEVSDYRLERLTAAHNERDYAAWTSSMEHIRATPGFDDHDWPHEMTLDDNRGDLVKHDHDFEAFRGFTYSVVSPEQGDEPEVIGCLYIYPSNKSGVDAKVRSWVTEARADLDKVLWSDVSDWLSTDWPFSVVDYAPRP